MHKLTKHHILPKSKHGSNYYQNLAILRDNIHKAFHVVFANDDPREQIVRLVANINISALTEEFRNDILKVLEENDKDYYYKKGIIVPKKK